MKLQLWDTSGQGRFCTIIRSYSRGAQGILLVYDITNKWSFDSIDRWLEEVEKVIRILFHPHTAGYFTKLYNLQHHVDSFSAGVRGLIKVCLIRCILIHRLIFTKIPCKQSLMSVSVQIQWNSIFYDPDHTSVNKIIKNCFRVKLTSDYVLFIIVFYVRFVCN